MTTIFNFKGNDLHTITLDGQPWFMFADLARILYGTTAGLQRVRRSLDQTEKRKGDRNTFGLPSGKPVLLVSESGLYKLIMRSDKDTARPFQDWVTKDVLPSIRKTGGYLLNEAAREKAHADTRSAMPLPEEFQRVFTALLQPVIAPLQAEVVSLKEHIERQNALIEKLAAGEEPADVWLNGDLVRDMSDRHIANAIRWAQRERMPHDVLIREVARRRRAKRAA